MKKPVTQEEQEAYRKYYREYYQKTKAIRQDSIHSYLKHAKKKLEYTKRWRKKS